MPPFIVTPTTIFPAPVPRVRPGTAGRPSTPVPGRYPAPQHRQPAPNIVAVLGNRLPAYYRGLPRWVWELAAN